MLSTSQQLSWDSITDVCRTHSSSVVNHRELGEGALRTDGNCVDPGTAQTIRGRCDQGIPPTSREHCWGTAMTQALQRARIQLQGRHLGRRALGLRRRRHFVPKSVTLRMAAAVRRAVRAEGRPLFRMELTLSDGRIALLDVWPRDDPREVASRFAAEHRLPGAARDTLLVAVARNMAAFAHSDPTPARTAAPLAPADPTEATQNSHSSDGAALAAEIESLDLADRGLDAVDAGEEARQWAAAAVRRGPLEILLFGNMLDQMPRIPPEVLSQTVLLHLGRNSLAAAPRLGGAVGRSLQRLCLEANAIGPDLHTLTIDGSLPCLQTLQVRGNLLESVRGLGPKYTPALRDLDLRDNLLRGPESLGDLSGLVSLRSLLLDGNPLTKRGEAVRSQVLTLLRPTGTASAGSTTTALARPTDLVTTPVAARPPLNTPASSTNTPRMSQDRLALPRRTLSTRASH